VSKRNLQNTPSGKSKKVRKDYADDVSMTDENTNTIKKNKEALLKASREVSLELNVEKMKYMAMSHLQNVRQNYNLWIANIL